MGTRWRMRPVLLPSGLPVLAVPRAAAPALGRRRRIPRKAREGAKTQRKRWREGTRGRVHPLNVGVLRAIPAVQRTRRAALTRNGSTPGARPQVRMAEFSSPLRRVPRINLVFGQQERVQWDEVWMREEAAEPFLAGKLEVHGLPGCGIPAAAEWVGARRAERQRQAFGRQVGDRRQEPEPLERHVWH